MEEAAYKELFEAEKKNWWYLGRKEQALMLLRKFLAGKKLKILDAGCGTGASIEFLREFGEVRGVDVSDDALNFCKKRGLTNVSKGDILKLPFKEKKFDLVVGLDVLEHVDETGKALNEFNRVLKKDGFLLITVPAFDFLWTDADEHLGHKKRFNAKELKMNLEKANFKIRKMSHRGLFYFFPLWIRILLLGRKMKRNIIYTNSIIKKFFILVLKTEGFFMQFVDYPFGTSIIAIAQKGGN